MRSKLHRLMSRTDPRHREPRPARSVPREVADRTTPFVAPPRLDEWQVVQVGPRCEALAVARLIGAGFVAYRPQMVRVVSAASVGRAAYVSRPLWPRYVILHRPAGITMSIRDIRDIGNPIAVGNLSGAAVEAISGREAGGEFDCRKSPPEGFSFDFGACVEWMDGLMSGIVLKSDEDRTVVLFRILEADREAHIETSKLRLKESA